MGSEANKILIVTRTFSPEICGVGDHTALLQSILVKHSFEVEIASFTKGNACHWLDSRKSFSEQIMAIVKGQKISIVFWQYGPYAFSQEGVPLGLIGIIQRIKRIGVSQIIFFS